MPQAHPAPSFPPETFRARRERYLERAGSAVTVLCAAPELHRSRDTEIRYRQDSDFHYLTGFPEPGAVAVLTPHDPERRFTLFVRPRDPEREAWSGPRAGVEGARERYGADAAYPVGELDAQLRTLLEPADEVVYALGTNPEMDRRVAGLVAGFRRSRPRSGKGPLVVRDPDTLLPEMRLVKEPGELDRIRRAAQISAAAHLTAMRAAHPGIGEWELEAVLDRHFRVAGGSGPAYPTIVGSGPNATVLHHVANDRCAADGDLVLIDAGAELGMYAGDITRTFPVSGRFSATQRAVYEIVLEAEEAGIAAVRPGASVFDPHDAAVRVLARGMVELGLLSGDVDELIESGAHRRFYMHQTSHWLGLDVHDVGPYRRGGEPVRLEPGMVLTVEPGIYVPETAEDVPEELRGIGVRIEDNLVVTPEGHEVLTRGVPVSIEEIEALVGSGGGG
ncbi:MAG TPA: aminopeptidase P N-terminal domain-containing protein [Longimicrobiaceae bacterium]|nr:aminopeptidase P N-terminal domain-containing protein [Longimicrobiaceae bacterium]